MSKVIKIEVTQDDIDNGDKKMCSSCPVALAIRRVLPSVGVFVHSASVCLDFENLLPIIIPLPDEAVTFIHLFDYSGWSIKPFTFELEVE